jgi:hypothetical protein
MLFSNIYSAPFKNLYKNKENKITRPLRPSDMATGAQTITTPLVKKITIDFFVMV